VLFTEVDVALSTMQQSAFNSYRYLIRRVDHVVAQDRGRLEDEIRVLLALGDTDFASERYQPALDHYLEAYAIALGSSCAK